MRTLYYLLVIDGAIRRLWSRASPRSPGLTTVRIDGEFTAMMAARASGK
jgi:hypothetical protein